MWLLLKQFYLEMSIFVTFDAIFFNIVVFVSLLEFILDH